MVVSNMVHSCCYKHIHTRTHTMMKECDGSRSTYSELSHRAALHISTILVQDRIHLRMTYILLKQSEEWIGRHGTKSKSSS